MAIFNSNKNTTFNPQEINILNAGTSIQGDLISEGDIRIDGTVKGNVQVKAKLVLGPSSNVIGNVSALNCDISGSVKGNIQVSELLAIKASAQINGDISCSKLIIESGASFNGKSEMKNSGYAADYSKAKNLKVTETKAPANGEAILEKAGV